MGYQSKVTSKGQTTIPAEVREHLKLKPGDRIEYRIEEGGVFVKARNKSVMGLAGILHRPGMKAVTIEEMDKAIGGAVAEDDERIKREWQEGIE